MGVEVSKERSGRMARSIVLKVGAMGFGAEWWKVCMKGMVRVVGAVMTGRWGVVVVVAWVEC